MIEWIVLALVSIASFIFEIRNQDPDKKLLGIKIITFYNIGNIIIVMLFGLYIYYFYGTDRSSEFFSGFVIEKMLSVDNIVVIKMIFSNFSIPQQYYSFLLLCSILGIIFLRIILIYFGLSVIAQFEWMMYVLGIILILTGIKMWTSSMKVADKKGKSSMLLFLEKYLPIEPNLTGGQLLSYKKLHDGRQKIYVSRLLVCFIALMFFDLVFAIDSVAGILSISQDLYVIYTSNILSILGLRYLYYIVSDIVHKYEYIHYSMSAILIYIGIKPFLHNILGIHLPAFVSLIIVSVILLMGIIYSKAQQNNAQG